MTPPAANPGSRTYDIEALIDNADHQLRSGMFARVRVPIGRRQAVLAPADAIIERVLYLDGVPNMQRMNPVRVGEDPVEQHRLDLAVETEAIERLNKGIAMCRDKGDNGTRELFENIGSDIDLALEERRHDAPSDDRVRGFGLEELDSDLERRLVCRNPEAAGGD